MCVHVWNNTPMLHDIVECIVHRTVEDMDVSLATSMSSTVRMRTSQKHVYWARGIPCQQGKHIGFHICCCIVDVETERYSAENITKDERNGSQAKMVCQTASIS